jgi:hypothetical protein
LKKGAMEKDGAVFRPATLKAILRNVINKLSAQNDPPLSLIGDLEMELWVYETAAMLENPPN